MTDRYDLGLHEGVSTSVHVEGRTATSVASFDAQAIVDNAAEHRATRQGHRWGDATHVGYIPMAVMGYWARHGMLNDQKVIREFFRKNPAFLTFDKYLK